MKLTAKERADLLVRAKAADEMAAQFSEDTFSRTSWRMIAEGYRELAEQPDPLSENERTGLR